MRQNPLSIPKRITQTIHKLPCTTVIYGTMVISLKYGNKPVILIPKSFKENTNEKTTDPLLLAVVSAKHWRE